MIDDLFCPEKHVRERALALICASPSREAIPDLVEFLKVETDLTLLHQAKTLLLQLAEEGQRGSRRDPYGIFGI